MLGCSRSRVTDELCVRSRLGEVRNLRQECQDQWSINIFRSVTLKDITQGDEVKRRGWGPSSVVECLPNVCKTQG